MVSRQGGLQVCRVHLPTVAVPVTMHVLLSAHWSDPVQSAPIGLPTHLPSGPQGNSEEHSRYWLQG
jgi:hypothetical protein